MGLYDRDYMRNEGGRPSRSAGADERAEEFASAFLRKHRRAVIVAGLVLAALIIAGLAMAFWQ